MARPRREPRSWFKNPEAFGLRDVDEAEPIAVASNWDRINVWAASEQWEFVNTAFNDFISRVDSARIDVTDVHRDDRGEYPVVPSDLARLLETMNYATFWRIFRGRTSMTSVQRADIEYASSYGRIADGDFERIRERGRRRRSHATQFDVDE